MAHRPNILTILVDDMGFSDIGCFGGEIDTPNLDALAAGGFRASQFYNTARCCPARACLLTGLYPHQAGVGMMVYRDYGEGYQGGLNHTCVTYAEVLRDAGYRTFLSGKWHCGHEPHSRPEVRGFDHVTAIYPHVDSYWKVLEGCDIYRDGEVFIPAGETPANPYHPDEPFHTTDFFTDVALEYLEQARSTPDEPFLLHLCYNAPHFPLEAPDDLVAKYRGRYRKGWDVLKREKLTRLKEMGLVHPEQQLPRATGFDLIKREPHDFHAAVDNGDLPDWETLSASDRRELDFRRALYAAQVEHLDRNLGRVVLALKAQGRFENTLIVFMSDNGCSGEVGPFGCNWGVNHEENFPEWKREGGWASSQGQCWASLSNAPFRKFKIFVHEGGIASPFIAHWPEGIADPGRIQTDQVFHLIDLMPTLCEVAGARYPSATSRGSITPLEGESMAGYFSDPHLSAEPRTLFWQHELNAAVRQGNWKLVTSNDRQDDAWELYDLSTDRSESRNLIERESGLADQLKTEWRSWSERVGVIPRPEDRDPFRPLPIGDPA